MIFFLLCLRSFAELIVRWLDGVKRTIKDADQQQQTVMTMNKRKLVMDSNKHMLNYVEIIPGEFAALNREFCDDFGSIGFFRRSFLINANCLMTKHCVPRSDVYVFMSQRLVKFIFVGREEKTNKHS